MARRYPILAVLCTSEHSPNPARWADPTTQHPCSRMDIPMAFTAKKTEHTGAKHRRGTYWGPKRDAKLESHSSGDVRGNAYCVMRSTHQSKIDKPRPALPASAGGWKAFIDAEEIIKKSLQTDWSLRVLCQPGILQTQKGHLLRGCCRSGGHQQVMRCACLSFVTISSLNNISRILYGFMLCCMTPR